MAFHQPCEELLRREPEQVWKNQTWTRRGGLGWGPLRPPASLVGVVVVADSTEMVDLCRCGVREKCGPGPTKVQGDHIGRCEIGSCRGRCDGGGDNRHPDVRCA